MLQRLIHSARVNVFESARFYYGVLMVLTFHLVARHSLIKILHVNGETEWFASKVITAFLYGFVYSCCIVSAVFLKKQISKLFLYTWLIVSCISVFNEFVFYLGDPNTYDFVYSISSGQGFMNIRITFPLLFLGVWREIMPLNYSKGILKLLLNIVLVNAICVCVGAVLNLGLFDSYPNSGRWGYSGFLARGYAVILSGVFLVYLLSFRRDSRIRILLLILALIVSGTKAGLLYLGLTVFIVVIRSNKIRILILSCVGLLLATISKWLTWIVSLSDFWSLVYEKHGVFGVISSLRNENLIRLKEMLQNDYEFLSLLVGGVVRSDELWVEILPIDLFLFFGVLGLVCWFVFFVRWIPNWKASIPLLVAVFSGTLLAAPMAVIVWGIGFELVPENK